MASGLLLEELVEFRPRFEQASLLYLGSRLG